jgi:transposase
MRGREFADLNAFAAIVEHGSFARAAAHLGVSPSALSQTIRSLEERRGAKKAILAVAASMLGACYYMLRDGVAYRDLGADHFARHDKLKTLGRLVRRLHDLGYEVELKQVA